MGEDLPSENKTAPKRAESDNVLPLVTIDDVLPPNLLLLPVVQATIFPGMIVPLILPEGKLTRTIEHVMGASGYLGLVVAKTAGEKAVVAGIQLKEAEVSSGVEFESTEKEVVALPDPPQEFYQYGVAVKVLKKINLPDNQTSVLLSGLQRFKLTQLVKQEPYFLGRVSYLHDELQKDNELEALLRSALSQFKQISKDNPLISEELKVALVNIDGPGKLADLMASVLIREISDYQDFLGTPDIKLRLHRLLMLLKKEYEVQSVQRKIQDEINHKVSSAQREFYLQEQLKSIQKELGRFTDEKTRITQKFRDRLKHLSPPADALKRMEEEIEKLQSLHEQSSEYSVCLNYLDWVTSLPWGVRSPENYELKKAAIVLDEDHFGLKEVKDRILEFLAVKKLRNTSEGSIICFVGPPGTGKTSLGRSIARALERKFFRFSVGGMRDEAEIKGHRRTYVGALPGKLIQGLKRSGSQNPVFLIDEIDKIGMGMAVGGDPASALLELLDSEQNSEFLDHYVDIPFNCSEIFFITTANTVDTIPSALLDRMEIIPLHGYTDSEKYQIAIRHLVPKILRKNGLKVSQLKFQEKGIRQIISQYAREAGVRQLEKQLSKISRKVAYRAAIGKSVDLRINSPSVVEKFLGAPPYSPNSDTAAKVPGVATGLAWTQMGGEVLFVESLSVPGKGGFVLTGSLGEVMQESANIAYTLIRGYCRKKTNLPTNYFEKNSFHLHVPAGATPKDGPSAGVTMAASLYSLISQKLVRPGFAMTGEITLTGQVLPVGGIKEKLLAAKRIGMKSVLIPKDNSKDLKELDPEVKRGLQIIKVASLGDCLKHLF